MSASKHFDFGRIRRYPVVDRQSKVHVEHFGRPFEGGGLEAFLNSLPHFLAADDLRALVSAIVEARRREKPVIWGFGGHVVKVGLAPILIDLMNQGFVTALATNGSGLIHDFEIALWGKTSEDVEAQLGEGLFGMAAETGQWINQLISEGAANGLGVGEAVGGGLSRYSPKYPGCSLAWTAYQKSLPLSVHVALGTDIVHCHPEASGEAIGKASLLDFRLFTEQIARLEGGGVFLNLGSAVILPEVFLKAVTAVRSSGITLRDFTTANFDFLQMYRPVQNVVRRPVKDGGRGISITGHHEIMVPLLAALLKTASQTLAN